MFLNILHNIQKYLLSDWNKHLTCFEFLLNFLVHILAGRLDKLDEGNNPENDGKNGDNNDIEDDANKVDLPSI